MKNIQLFFILCVAASLQSNALPIWLTSMLKTIARHTRAKTQTIKAQMREFKAQAVEPLARRKHPAAIPFTPSRLRPVIATRRILTHRLAPITLTGFASTAAAIKYKEQQEAKLKEAKLKLDAYNADVMNIFAHGMKSSAKAGLHRHVNSQRPGAFIQDALVSFDFKDTAQASSASFGQEDDVRKLEEVCNAYPEQRKILVGSSRGAATCMNYLGSKQVTDIGAAVIESPFASMETLITGPYRPLFRWWFPHYQPHGLQPVNTAPTIAKDIPVFIFCSKDDELIPVSQTIDLYNTLRSSGHTKSHLMIVDNGAHAKILGNKDGQRVRNAIHAFYKEYNIPHNEAWATDGQESFKQTNPTPEQLKSISSKVHINGLMRIIKMSGSASGSR